MDHLKSIPTECKHKMTLEGQRLICAYCGETFKL